MSYEIVIGLEVHLHLKTKTKAFCGCSTEFGNEPNTQVCPVCLGFPGSLPVYNKLALEYAIKVALALNCEVQGCTKFDRKNYFYPDLPKNYQISQYDLALSRDGFLDIERDGKIKKIGILRVHMEEDAGKLIHKDQISLVDFNRAGVPLLEIVSQPQINSPQEAYAYLVSLKSILEYLDVSDCDMEKGSLRCDANISIRKAGAGGLGVKAELKNMNSFKAVKDALAYEAKRQTAVLDEGGSVVQETRLWDERQQKTISMRVKEGAQDYRYFPEPDLAPFIIEKVDYEKIKKSIPELPREKLSRFMKEYGLSAYDARVLVSSRGDATLSEECLKAYTLDNKKKMVNFLIGPLLSEANGRNSRLSDLGVSAQSLVDLVGYLDGDKISNLVAKSVLKDMIDSAKPASEIIQSKNLLQISDTGALEKQVDQVVRENPKSIEAYREGKTNALMFLVGQVMKRTGGKANPKVVLDLLKKKV